jgi:hypothetical protein
MALAKRYKTILRLLIEIAEHGNDYEGDLSHDEQSQVGALIAGIQNDLGEMNDGLLNRLGLFYDGTK